MPLICLNCRNKTKFVRRLSGWMGYSENEFVDEDEQNIDYGDMEYGDSEITDVGSLYCAECESERVDEVEDEVWQGWKGPNHDYCNCGHVLDEHGRCTKCQELVILAEQFEF